MNRMQLWSHEARKETASSDVSQSLLSLSGGQAARRAFFSPLHYEPNYAYPLLIWLHGPGGDETQLKRIMPLVSTRNYVAAAPRCGNGCGNGRGTWCQTSRGIDEARQAVFDCLDMAREKYNLASDRVFLAGLQDGGTMATRIALQSPDIFAGALTIGGPFPVGAHPLAALDKIRKMPLFIALGRDSTTYPIDICCQEMRLFHSAGLSVSVRQYPCGDEVDSHMLRDMDVWMMEQITGQTA